MVTTSHEPPRIQGSQMRGICSSVIHMEPFFFLEAPLVADLLFDFHEAVNLDFHEVLLLGAAGIGLSLTCFVVRVIKSQRPLLELWSWFAQV